MATCPYGGHPSIKYGTYKEVQRYYCNTCERKFTLQDTFFAQHHDRALVVQALTYYFNGVSMQKISDMICDLSGQNISKMQVYRWLVKYSQLASDWASRLEPDVGVSQTPADRARISNGIRNWADLLEQAVPSIKELGSIALPRGCLQCVNEDEW